jgi:hypothetical protein
MAHQIPVYKNKIVHGPEREKGRKGYAFNGSTVNRK